jgi:hypothetical protein
MEKKVSKKLEGPDPDFLAKLGAAHNTGRQRHMTIMQKP